MTQWLAKLIRPSIVHVHPESDLLYAYSALTMKFGKSFLEYLVFRFQHS